MEKIDGYDFGKPYTEEIPIEEADKFANIFGEGSKTLTELIKYCILNRIVTFASCKGHPEEKNIIEKVVETGYITFRFDMNYDDNDFAYFLASIPFNNKEIKAYLNSNSLSDRTITLRVPAKAKGMSEKYFEFILNEIKKYQKMKEENIEFTINPEIKKIIDYIFYSWKPYESFEITSSSYKKYERNGAYLNKVATCPSNNITGVLHKKYGKLLYLSKKQDIDSFITSSRKNK